jgi:hypothetical protein
MQVELYRLMVSFSPKASWPRHIHPAFPFPCYRYETFLQTIKQLAKRGTCQYLPCDWYVMQVSEQPRVVDLKAGTVVRGKELASPRCGDRLLG